jgi:hypothetical protein
MVGPTPQERITGWYLALGAGLLVLVLLVTVLILARRKQMRMPLASYAAFAVFGCIAAGLAAQAGVRLLGIHASRDTTDLALGIQFATIGVAYLVLGVLGVTWIRRRRTRGRAGGRGSDD